MKLTPILKRVGMTQRELAHEVGVREEQVSRWVHGHHAPGSRQLLAVLAALQRRDPAVTLGELMSVEEAL